MNSGQEVCAIFKNLVTVRTFSLIHKRNFFGVMDEPTIVPPIDFRINSSDFLSNRRQSAISFLRKRSIKWRSYLQNMRLFWWSMEFLKSSLTWWCDICEDFRKLHPLRCILEWLCNDFSWKSKNLVKNGLLFQQTSRNKWLIAKGNFSISIKLC